MVLNLSVFAGMTSGTKLNPRSGVDACVRVRLRHRRRVRGVGRRQRSALKNSGLVAMGAGTDGEGREGKARPGRRRPALLPNKTRFPVFRLLWKWTNLFTYSMNLL